MNVLNRFCFPMLPLVLMILLWGLPGSVFAHDFKVGLLVPLSGAEAAAGEDMVNAFKLAAAERDGHPNEEADGHLGGLDVYLLLIDTSEGRARAMDRVQTLLNNPGLHFVSGTPPASWKADIAQVLDTGEALWIGLERLSRSYTQNMNGQPWAEAYQQAYNEPPGETARAGYALARLLDAAVRRTGDDFSDASKTRTALEQAEQQ